MKKYKGYTREINVEAVRFVIGEGRSIPDLARKIDINESILTLWKKKSEEGKINPVTLDTLEFR